MVNAKLLPQGRFYIKNGNTLCGFSTCGVQCLYYSVVPGVEEDRDSCFTRKPSEPTYLLLLPDTASHLFLDSFCLF